MDNSEGMRDGYEARLSEARAELSATKAKLGEAEAQLEASAAAAEKAALARDSAVAELNEATGRNGVLLRRIEELERENDDIFQSPRGRQELRREARHN